MSAAPRRWVALAGSLILAASAAAPAAAETARPTLPAQLGGTHFVLHFDPATASGDYVAAGLADFEEAYSRLVLGAGGTPNAGLRAPVNDGTRGGDARVDVYLTAPPWSPTYVGGVAAEDDATHPDPLVDSGFLYMTPSLSRVGFRFRAAHELMHVIQDAYLVTSGLFTESTANWAAETALPDIEPGDSQFIVPFLPLNCSYGEWEGKACGNGYRQWLFFQQLTERYGLGFIHRLWMRHRVDCPCLGTTPTTDRQILDHAITDEPGDATLATSYAEYAQALWDPTIWATTAIDKIHREDGPPVADPVGLSRAALTVGPQTTIVDHLATRYLRIAHAGASAPGDQVKVSVSGGTGRTPALLSGVGPGRQRAVTPLAPTGGGAFEASVSLDAAAVSDVVLPLTNDSITDDVPFTWRAELVPGGAPAGPANDERGAPMRIQPRTMTQLDVAYAGGLGAVEAPECATTRTATRGVWFVILVDQGPLTFDPTGSDFDAATAVYDISIPGRTTLWACSQGGDRGKVGGDTFAREYLVYVGRAATSTGTGHRLRLAVDGVPNPFGTEPPEDVTPPVVSGLSVSPKRFRASKRGGLIATARPAKGGARVRFSLSEAGSTRLAVEREASGRVVGGRCVKTTAKNRRRKRCVHLIAIGGAEQTGLPVGQTQRWLTGRRSTRKALAAGRYRLRATPTDLAGNRGAAVTTPFTIKR